MLKEKKNLKEKTFKLFLTTGIILGYFNQKKYSRKQYFKLWQHINKSCHPKLF